MRGTIMDEGSRTTEPVLCSTKKDGAEVDRISHALADLIGSQKYRIWFKDSTTFTLSGGYLKVGVPNLFIANWIENHFLTAITRAAHSVIETTPKVTFTIDPHLSSPRPQVGANRTEFTESKSILKTEKTKLRTQNSKLRLTLDNFVVGPSNELAYSAAKAVVREQHSPFNPLFIHGGYGVGKTHLLQGICNEVSKIRLGTNWLYLSAEDFANQFVLALKTKKLEAFRHRMRQTDLLAIDDIHFLASKPSTQEEFLHTFNTINLAGKQVVLVSDAHPKMIGQLSEKLVNRFISGMVVKIEPPDFQTRCRICRQYMKTHRLKISTQNSESIIKYIAEKLRTNVRELEGALLKLVAYSALQNENITLSMAQKVLAEHLERCDPIAHVTDIESAVATYFGTTPALIHSPRKDRTLTLARHFSMYLTRKHTKMSSSEIGRFMGNKNHATVLAACKKIEDLLKRNADINWSFAGSPGRSNKIAKARTVLSQIEESISQ